jgi:hypothetical protein
MRLSKLSDEARTAPSSSYGAVHDSFWLFDLSGLVPGRKLLINISLSIVSLLPGKDDPIVGDKPRALPVLAQRILTNNEMRMLLPLLDTPTCCQQAVLQASLCCAYELLLQSLFSSDEDTNVQWKQLVEAQRNCLYRAQEKKSQRTQMRGVYNALFTLRQKLEPFGLAIRSSRDGYYLTLLESKYLKHGEIHKPPGDERQAFHI